MLAADGACEMEARLQGAVRRVARRAPCVARPVAFARAVLHRTPCVTLNAASTRGMLWLPFHHMSVSG